MGRPFILHYDEIPDEDCIHCLSCKTRVAFMRDHLATIPNLSWIFHNVFNVEVPEGKEYQVEKDGKTLAETYCIKCGDLLGWKLIAIVKPCMYIREGVFFISLRKIGRRGANVQNVDQDEGANEQVPNDQQGGANEQNDEQEGDADEPTIDENADIDN